MIPNFNNPEKNGARERVLGSLPKRQYNSVLTLPGQNALDVLEMLRQEIITADTNQTWIEQSASELFGMAKTRDDLVARGLLTDKSVEIIHSRIQDFSPTRKYDLVNLDLMSGITPDIGYWIWNTLRNNIEHGTTALVTVTGWSRSPFWTWFMNADSLYPDEMQIIRSHCETDDTYTCAVVLLMMSAFAGHSFDQIPALRYEGSGERFHMLTVRMDNIVKAGPQSPDDWPSFNDILLRYEREVPSIDRAVPDTRLRDTRSLFLNFLAKSNMALNAENGREVLYHTRGRLTPLIDFASLEEALRHFGR